MVEEMIINLQCHRYEKTNTFSHQCKICLLLFFSLLFSKWHRKNRAEMPSRLPLILKYRTQILHSFCLNNLSHCLFLSTSFRKFFHTVCSVKELIIKFCLSYVIFKFISATSILFLAQPAFL